MKIYITSELEIKEKKAEINFYQPLNNWDLFIYCIALNYSTILHVNHKTNVKRL